MPSARHKRFSRWNLDNSTLGNDPLTHSTVFVLFALFRDLYVTPRRGGVVMRRTRC